MVTKPSKRKSCLLNNDVDGGAGAGDIRRTPKALKFDLGTGPHLSANVVENEETVVVMVDPVDQDRQLEEEQEDEKTVEDIYIPLNDVSPSAAAHRIRYRYESELPINKWWKEEEGEGDNDGPGNDNEQWPYVHGNRQSRRRCRGYSRRDRKHNELLFDNLEALMSCLDVNEDSSDDDSTSQNRQQQQQTSSSSRSDIKSTFQMDDRRNHYERLLRLIDEAERISNSKHSY